MITQEEVDEVHPIALAEWNRMKGEFDGSDVLFTMSHEAIQFLAEYEQVKEFLAENGFDIPPLVEGIQVTLS
tara:strand:- start:9533 stop:9748 length:216 start_codon:yes stop_codon:yes gene_type:complete